MVTERFHHLYELIEEIWSDIAEPLATAEHVTHLLARAGLPRTYHVFPPCGELSGWLIIRNALTDADLLICWNGALTETQLMRTVFAWRDAGEPRIPTLARIIEQDTHLAGVG
jgi:hypothetical protein